MNRKRTVAFAASALVLGIAAAGCRAPSERRVVDAGGMSRTFRVHVPPNLPTGARVPLLLALHGGGSNGRQMERYTGLDALADREGFIVAYPDAWKRNWNDGRGDEDIPSQAENVDDIAFFRTLLDDLEASLPVDPKRIYATGISNGGFMCHKLGVALPDRFAAIAPVVGGMAPLVAENAAHGPPVAVFIIQGTADLLVPYSGGEVAKSRGSLVDTLLAARLWAGRNGCTTVVDGVGPDGDPNDGCRVRTRDWSGGAAPVRLWTIHGGGHVWPGGRQYLPSTWVGPACRDFSGNEVIWAFLREQSRK